MITIDTANLFGKKYTTAIDSNTEWTCIGYGQNADGSGKHLVGTTWDQTNNRSRISTHLIKDVTIIGKLC